jgi:hypothetical protein
LRSNQDRCIESNDIFSAQKKRKKIGKPAAVGGVIKKLWSNVVDVLFVTNEVFGLRRIVLLIQDVYVTSLLIEVVHCIPTNELWPCLNVK